ncbi:hypothetical protein E8E14_013490 [Neopestalotiopsis sp. 37M]|nr:hypothetical protein E8E14_013490 [Neopestalotiopsis sp. 37M]
MAGSSPIMRQSLVQNSKDVYMKGKMCKGNRNDQISPRNNHKTEVPEKQNRMHHQGTGPIVAAASRRRPGPAQGNISRYRELFASDTGSSDWYLVLEIREQRAEFPHMDQPNFFLENSALWWETEYTAADVIDRPLSGFKEVKRLHVEKTNELTFFKKKLTEANRIRIRVARDYFNSSCRDEESANDYRMLKYAELLLTHRMPILESQQTMLHDLMEAMAKAYSQIKVCKRFYKQPAGHLRKR